MAEVMSTLIDTHFDVHVEIREVPLAVQLRTGDAYMGVGNHCPVDNPRARMRELARWINEREEKEVYLSSDNAQVLNEWAELLPDKTVIVRPEAVTHADRSAKPDMEALLSDFLHLTRAKSLAVSAYSNYGLVAAHCNPHRENQWGFQETDPAPRKMDLWAKLVKRNAHRVVCVVTTTPNGYAQHALVALQGMRHFHPEWDYKLLVDGTELPPDIATVARRYEIDIVSCPHDRDLEDHKWNYPLSCLVPLHAYQCPALSPYKFVVIMDADVDALKRVPDVWFHELDQEPRAVLSGQRVSRNWGNTLQTGVLCFHRQHAEEKQLYEKIKAYHFRHAHKGRWGSDDFLLGHYLALQAKHDNITWKTRPWQRAMFCCDAKDGVVMHMYGPSHPWASKPITNSPGWMHASIRNFQRRSERMFSGSTTSQVK
jgi:hypothetical protein